MFKGLRERDTFMSEETKDYLSDFKNKYDKIIALFNP